MSDRWERHCNACGHRYSWGRRSCPVCGSRDTGSRYCFECDWAYDPRDYDSDYEETCPRCGDSSDDLGEMWDNLHDDDWMFPNR